MDLMMKMSSKCLIYIICMPISLRTTVMMSPSYGSLRSQYSCAYFQSYDFLQIPFWSIIDLNSRLTTMAVVRLDPYDYFCHNQINYCYNSECMCIMHRWFKQQFNNNGCCAYCRRCIADLNSSFNHNGFVRLDCMIHSWNV